VLKTHQIQQCIGKADRTRDNDYPSIGLLAKYIKTTTRTTYKFNSTAVRKWNIETEVKGEKLGDAKGLYLLERETRSCQWETKAVGFFRVCIGVYISLWEKKWEKKKSRNFWASVMIFGVRLVSPFNGLLWVIELGPVHHLPFIILFTVKFVK
jgi:hypothetical protein